jgi:fructose-bisphosphate aldolase, class I
MDNEKLYRIALQLVTPGKGILAADQSPKTIDVQLAAVGAPADADTRRKYRQLLFTTAGIEKYVTGVILYDATIRNQADDKTPFIDILMSKGIIPIIKVDKSTVPMTGFPGEVVTEGLDGLKDRLAEYYAMGARAAKWRAVITISEQTPTEQSIRLNCIMLARYAILCQEAGIVPIVEPEVIFAGSHSLQKAEEVTTWTLRLLFETLAWYKVDFRGLILKSSMVLAGSNHPDQTRPEQVAEATLRTFHNSVPHEVPGIVFLSGGQSPERATTNLDAIADLEKSSGGLPWQLAFSFSRGLEEPVQQAWGGDPAKILEAQNVLIETLKKNCRADKGEL